MSFFGLTKKDVRQARGLKKNINRKFHIILFYFIFFLMQPLSQFIFHDLFLKFYLISMK